MKPFPRRRFLASAALGSLALAGARPQPASAQSAVTLRISSSLTADQNSAHYIWYQRFAANVKDAVGPRRDSGIFPEQPARQGSRCRAAGEGRLDRHDDHRILDLGDGRARVRHARPGLRVRQQCPRGEGARRRCRAQPGEDPAGPDRLHGDRMGVALRRAQRVYQNTGHVARRDQGRQAARSAHHRLHRDVQADGRDPDPDPVQRALHRRADRGGGRLRARRCHRARDQAVSKCRSTAGSPSICSAR